MAQDRPEELQPSINRLREWLKERSEFPQNVDDKLLLRFLHSSYYDVDKAKKVLELFFNIRSSMPQVLRDRDPFCKEIQDAISITKLALLHLPGKRNVWIYHLDDPGLKKYEYIPTVKLSFLQTDAWLLDDEVLEEEDIVILDVQNINFKILTRLDMSMEKIFNKYQQEALPVRLKQIHVVNVPSFFSIVYSLLKPFLNKEVRDKIQFHSPKSESIFNFLSKDDLPEEYGGTNGKMEEHTKTVIDGIIKNREYLLKENLWTVNEDNSINEDENLKKSADINEALRTLVIK